MDIRHLFDETEKPLDNLVTDGGFAAIFRTVACIGDSLSSGEFEAIDTTGKRTYHDMFPYSWGQFMAREAGFTVHNFSRGGMSAKEYIDTFAEAQGFWRPDLAAQAYIIAMGVNDFNNLHWYEDGVGTVADIAPDWRDNKKSFVGYYAAIIQRYKLIQPEAKFFLMTMPRTEEPYAPDAHSDAIYALAAYFGNCYVLDLRQYGPCYDAFFESKFYLNGHLNPMGYRLTATMTLSYIDYIIRHNMDDFKQIGFIGTGIKNVTEPPYNKKI